MKTRILLIVMLAFVGWSANAQITFQKTFGESVSELGYSVQQTTDGGYIIAGYANSIGTARDCYLIKTNAYGDTLWTKVLGGDSLDESWSVTQTQAGGFAITGSTKSFGSGNQDIYLIITDSAGGILSSKTYGGAYSASPDYGRSIQQTLDGGFIITGGIYTYSNTEDMLLIKTNSVGDSLWTRAYGGANGEVGFSVHQTFDGGYIAVGYSNSFPINNIPSVYLVKTNGNGDTLWTKTYKGTVQDYGENVIQTLDSGYIITGYTNSFGAGNYDAFLLKTNSHGDTLWTRTYGGTNSDKGFSVQMTNDGGYVIIGTTSSFGGGSGDIYLIKTNSNGDTLWTKTFGGTSNEDGYSIQCTSDNGFIITGDTKSFGAGLQDVYLIKTDSLGNSGCNQYHTATIVGRAPFQVGNSQTLISHITSIHPTATISGHGGIVSNLCTTVNIENITIINEFQLFPNPASTTITIHRSMIIPNQNITLTDVFGRKVYAQALTNSTESTIDISPLSNGIYFYEVAGQRGKIVKD